LVLYVGGIWFDTLEMPPSAMNIAINRAAMDTAIAAVPGHRLLTGQLDLILRDDSEHEAGDREIARLSGLTMRARGAPNCAPPGPWSFGPICDTLDWTLPGRYLGC
jgi:hypothetical protein